MTILDWSPTTTLPADQPTVWFFWAPWHEESLPTGPIAPILDALAQANVSIVRTNAEEHASLAQQYQITAVPTFVLCDKDSKVFEKLEGIDQVAQLTQAVARLAAGAEGVTEAAPPTTVPSLSSRLDALIRSSTVMLFMKGTPDAPRCGFSRQMVELLQAQEVPFGAFDILNDEEVRQGLKTHSNWPTYPQLYVKGELVGGLDIVKEMVDEDGPLKEQWQLVDEPKPLTLNQRLKRLIHRHEVMLFMKGLPSAPRCGFSRQMVELLRSLQVDFDSFDILTDEDVRQGLKVYSDWPTYPQLYVKGDLIGGLDIVKEMQEDGSLQELFRQ